MNNIFNYKIYSNIYISLVRYFFLKCGSFLKGKLIFFIILLFKVGVSLVF